jgi:hypothetical protein
MPMSAYADGIGLLSFSTSRRRVLPPARRCLRAARLAVSSSLQPGAGFGGSVKTFNDVGADPARYAR